MPATSNAESGEVSFCFTFFGPISPHELLFFPTRNAGEVETAGTGDWPRPGLQPDLCRWSASPALSLRVRCIATERARGTRLPCRPRAAGVAETRRVRRQRRPRCRAARAAPATLLSSAELHVMAGYDGEVSFCFTLIFGPISPDELLFFATADSATQVVGVGALVEAARQPRDGRATAARGQRRQAGWGG